LAHRRRGAVLAVDEGDVSDVPGGDGVVDEKRLDAGTSMVSSACSIGSWRSCEERLEVVSGGQALRVMAMPSLWGSLIKTKLIRVRARKRERGGSREEWQHSLGSPEF
jgi:hypothetical protein